MAYQFLITANEVAKEAGLRLDLPFNFCKDHVHILAMFCDPWESIGRHLGLNDAIINGIKEDSSTAEKRRTVMLQLWKEKFAHKATYRVLIQALIDCGRAQQALELCQKIKELRPSSESDGASYQSPITANVVAEEAGLCLDSPYFRKDHVHILAMFCDPWENIGYHLGLDDAIINIIKEDNSTTEKRRTVMLQLWKEKFAHKATYRVLIQALIDCGRSQQALELCHKIKELQPASESDGASYQSPITANEVAEEAGLCLDLPFCKDHVHILAMFCDPWDSIGCHLGLNDTIINSIKEDNSTAEKRRTATL